MNLIYETLWNGEESGLLVSMLEKVNWFCLIGLITLVPIDGKMDESFLEEKSSFKILRLTFSSKLDWGSYIISIAKTASKKIRTLIRSIKFISPEVAICPFKSTIRPCMEYCCHVWAGVHSCFLELLGKLQKQIYMTVDASLAASIEPLGNRKPWFHFFILEGVVLIIVIDYIIFCHHS